MAFQRQRFKITSHVGSRERKRSFMGRLIDNHVKFSRFKRGACEVANYRNLQKARVKRQRRRVRCETNFPCARRKPSAPRRNIALVDDEEIVRSFSGGHQEIEKAGNLSLTI